MQQILEKEKLRSPLLDEDFLLNSLFPRYPPRYRYSEEYKKVGAARKQNLSNTMLLTDFQNFLYISYYISLSLIIKVVDKVVPVFLCLLDYPVTFKIIIFFYAFLHLYKTPDILIRNNIHYQQATLVTIRFLSTGFSHFSVNPLPYTSCLNWMRFYLPIGHAR